MRSLLLNNIHNFGHLSPLPYNHRWTFIRVIKIFMTNFRSEGIKNIVPASPLELASIIYLETNIFKSDITLCKLRDISTSGK